MTLKKRIKRTRALIINREKDVKELEEKYEKIKQELSDANFFLRENQLELELLLQDPTYNKEIK